MPGRLDVRVSLVSLFLVACWGLLLGVVFLLPSLIPSPDPGDDLIRNTVRLALLFYLPAAALMLQLEPPGWRGATAPGRIARLCWLLALLAYLVHVAVAFQYAHHWSHAEAMRHVEEVSGFGPGIFVSYLFTLVWTADAIWWLLRPGDYARRPAWIDWTLHGFMAFIIFNAAIVYETGFIRWAGLGLFAVLGWRLWTRRSIHPQGETP
jgi:hypothetical protein